MRWAGGAVTHKDAGRPKLSLERPNDIRTLLGGCPVDLDTTEQRKLQSLARALEAERIHFLRRVTKERAQLAALYRKAGGR